MGRALSSSPRSGRVLANQRGVHRTRNTPSTVRPLATFENSSRRRVAAPVSPGLPVVTSISDEMMLALLA